MNHCWCQVLPNTKFLPGLVNVYRASELEHDPVEIVDKSPWKVVDLSSSLLTQRLPGRVFLLSQYESTTSQPSQPSKSKPSQSQDAFSSMGFSEKKPPVLQHGAWPTWHHSSVRVHRVSSFQCLKSTCHPEILGVSLLWLYGFQM